MTTGENKDTAETQPNAEPEIIDVEVIKEEAAPAASSVNASDKAQKKSSKLGWISTAVLAAFIGGLYAAPYFKAGLTAIGLLPASPPPIVTGASVNLEPLETSINDLKAQLLRHREILAQHEGQITAANETAATFSDKLNNLELTTPVTQPGTDVASSELLALKAATERLSGDVARLAALNTGENPVVTQLTGSIALLKAETRQITNRFATLETALADIQASALDASPRGRLLLTLSRVKERALKGFAFSNELAALRPDIAALSTVDQQLIGAEFAHLQQASSGIETYEDLTRSFDSMAAAALQSAQKEDGNFLSSLFTVRRTDAGATGNDSVFLAAERKLARHDLASAITELENLEGAALTSTKAWRDKAQLFANTERAFERIISTITNTPSNIGGQQ